MDLDDLQGELAKSVLDWHESIRKILGPLPDEDLPSLAEECRRTSQPTADRTFPMPVWNLIAEVIDTEHAMRVSFKRAVAYMEKTGEGVYCIHCDGACTPEHRADFEDS